MNGFNYLTRESYYKIKHLNRTSKIDDSTYRKFEDLKNEKDVFQVLRENFSFSPKKENIGKILVYLLFTVTELDRDNMQKSVCLNQWHWVFMKKILENGGIYDRTRCQKELLTDQQISKQISFLEEINVIIILKTRRSYDNSVYYILHPEIIRKNLNET